MKKSEMLSIILEFLHGGSLAPIHVDQALSLLNTIEKAGMLPPGRKVQSPWTTEDDLGNMYPGCYFTENTWEPEDDFT